jgi:TM2 domain-containing membrane protein YozV
VTSGGVPDGPEPHEAALPPPPPPQPPPAQWPPPGASTPSLSPDGRWWWNGAQWVPSPVPPPPMSSQHNRVTAGVLAILLGDFGIHKFYLGQKGMGILYLCFFWTIVPGILGIIEGIQYLSMSDTDFAVKYG